MAPTHSKMKTLIPAIFTADKTFTVGIRTKNMPRATRFYLWLFYKGVL